MGATRLARIFLLLSLLWQAVLTTRVSLTDTNAYESARPCMKKCFGNQDVNWLAQNMKCDENNECVCRQDLQPSAVAHLRSCIGSYCDKVDSDITYGVSLYTSYCTAAGFGAAAVAAPTTSEVGSVPSSPSQTTPPAQSSLVVTTTSDSRGSGSFNLLSTRTVDVDRTTTQIPPAESSSLSGGGTQVKGASISNETIGIIVGVLGIVIALVGVYYTRKAYIAHAKKKELS